MKCEHGNEITVLIEWIGHYWDDGINKYLADGSQGEFKEEGTHLKIVGCPRCQFIQVKVTKPSP